MRNCRAFFADATASSSERETAAVVGEASRRLAVLCGLPLPVLFGLQRHTAVTFAYGAEGKLAAGPHLVGTCDALITGESNVAMVVVTADCLPVVVAGNGVAGIAHAGWRGLAADVLGALVRRIGAEFGVARGDLSAIVGVGVGPCHYEVGEEVVAALAGLEVGEARWRSGSRVDLSAWARGRLVALGLQTDEVRSLRGCTACSPRFHSYRRDGAGAGRQWSAVVVETEER